MADLNDEAAVEAAAAVLGDLFGAASEYEKGLRREDAHIVVRAVWPFVEAPVRQQIAHEIAGSVPYNFELNYDGTEDPLRAAYVEGVQDAHGIVAARVVRGDQENRNDR